MSLYHYLHTITVNSLSNALVMWKLSTDSETVLKKLAVSLNHHATHLASWWSRQSIALARMFSYICWSHFVSLLITTEPSTGARLPLQLHLRPPLITSCVLVYTSWSLLSPSTASQASVDHNRVPFLWCSYHPGCWTIIVDFCLHPFSLMRGHALGLCSCPVSEHLWMVELHLAVFAEGYLIKKIHMENISAPAKEPRNDFQEPLIQRRSSGLRRGGSMSM